MHVSLIRFRVVDGASDEVARWMDTLRARHDECVAALDRERMAVESIFLHDDREGEWIFWFVLHGDGEPVETSDHDLDQVHRDFMSRCLVRESRLDLGPELVLLHPALAEAAATLEIVQPRYVDANEGVVQEP